jgi:hypothetical protein
MQISTAGAGSGQRPCPSRAARGARSAAQSATLLTARPCERPQQPATLRHELSVDQTGVRALDRARRARLPYLASVFAFVFVRRRSSRRLPASTRSSAPGPESRALGFWVRLSAHARICTVRRKCSFGPSSIAGAASWKSLRLVICHDFERLHFSKAASSSPSFVNSGNAGRVTSRNFSKSCSAWTNSAAVSIRRPCLSCTQQCILSIAKCQSTAMWQSSVD